MQVIKIGQKLVMGYFVMAFFALATSGGVSFILIEQYLSAHEREQLDYNVKNLAIQLAPLMIPTMQRERFADVVNLSYLLGDFQTKVFDRDGTLLVQSPSVNDNQNNWSEDEALFNLRIAAPGGEKASRSRSTRKVEGSTITGGGPLGIRWHISRTPMSAGGYVDVRYLCTIGTEGLGADRPQGSVPEIRQNDARIDTQDGNGSMPSTLYARDFERSLLAEIEGPFEVAGYIELFHVNDHVLSTLRYFASTMIFAAIVAVVLATFLGFSFSKGVAKSLRRLQVQAGKIESGDLNARASMPTERILEIRELSATFDNMVSRIRTMIAERDSDREALRRFIADASHEIRTPLSAVSNFIELLQGAASEDRDARRHFLKESERQIERLQWINRNLLDLTRFDSGLFVMKLEPCELFWLIEEAAEALRSNARKRSIRLVFRGADDKLVALCDREWITVALGNLIDNAIKHSRYGALVEIGARLTEDTRFVELWIADDGEGIAEEDLPHIFERFYRGKTTASGSGLGLAIVQSIILLHEGQLTVSSIRHAGSRFTIRLPVDGRPNPRSGLFK